MDKQTKSETTVAPVNKVRNMMAALTVVPVLFLGCCLFVAVQIFNGSPGDEKGDGLNTLSSANGATSNSQLYRSHSGGASLEEDDSFNSMLFTSAPEDLGATGDRLSVNATYPGSGKSKGSTVASASKALSFDNESGFYTTSVEGMTVRVDKKK